MKGSEIKYVTAQTPASFQIGAMLFREYAQSLDFNLSFQRFDEELKQISAQYAAPSGSLILAEGPHQKVLGCVGVRRLEEKVCELKRMYVVPTARGLGIGRGLLVAALEASKQMEYNAIRLDTIDNMHEAIALYEAYGFEQIPAYRHNPMPGALYYEAKI